MPKETCNFTTLAFFNQRKYLVIQSRLQEQIFTQLNTYTRHIQIHTNTRTGERRFLKNQNSCTNVHLSPCH